MGSYRFAKQVIHNYDKHCYVWKKLKVCTGMAFDCIDFKI